MSFVVLALLVVMVIVFMRITSAQHRLTKLEACENKYLTYEDYLETFNNLLDAKLQGINLSPLQ
jgi:hypothetical protein